MHKSVTEASICKANGQFWEQMLAMQLDPILDPDRDPVRESEERCIGCAHVVASCDLAGAWSGRIEVRLASGLATEATAAMLMQPTVAVQPEDILDATREIANMIAGTLKSALPRPCTMTVPNAESEPENFCILPRTEDSVTVFFHHASGELMVRVLESPRVVEGECNLIFAA
jgi:CheY-specific phosphatase CheX